MSGDLELDVRGLRCPLPVIRLARAVQDARDGTLVVVLATDPAAEPDVAAWCRLRGHELVDQVWRDGESGRELVSRLRVRATRPAAEPPARPADGAGTPDG